MFPPPRLVALLLILGSSCEPTRVSPEPCASGETRCVGKMAQICDGDHNWVELMHCDEVAELSGNPHDCMLAPSGKGHTCLPVDAGAP